MKNTARVLIGGALVACGCGFFLYPNFREWNTQREVEQIIETFDKTYDRGLNESGSVTHENDSKTTKKADNKKDEHAKVTTKAPTKLHKTARQTGIKINQLKQPDLIRLYTTKWNLITKT